MKRWKFLLESLSTNGGELLILLVLNFMYSVAMYFRPELYTDSHNLVLGALLLIVKTNYTKIKTEYDRLNSEEEHDTGKENKK